MVQHARRSLRGVALAVLGCGLLAGGRGALADAAPPTTEAALVGTVRQALQAHDLDTLQTLVDWDGITPFRRRLVVYQMRYAFGRPIRSAALEPFPSDGLDELKALGTLKVNMPVTEQLRVVFDEPDAQGHVPSVVFLIGRQDQAFRIALVVPTKPGGGARQ